MEVEGEGKGERGTLPRPSSLDGLVSDELWAKLNDYRRRVLIEIMDRTGIDDKTRVVPNIKFPPEAHFAPAPPGCRFKAMIPSEGYWEFGREQQEERAARWEREKRERQEREEVKRLEREEIRRRAFEEAMERDALDEANQRRALEDEIRQSRAAPLPPFMLTTTESPRGHAGLRPKFDHLIADDGDGSRSGHPGLN